MNNRELALLVSASIGFVLILFVKDIRAMIGQLIVSFFYWKFVIIYTLMILYVFLLVYLLFQLNLWNFSLTKDAIVWFAFTAFANLFAVDKACKDPVFFKKIIFDNLKVVVIIEFILNAYVFNLTIELILVPISIFLGALGGFAKIKKHVQVGKIANLAISILVFSIFLFSIYQIIRDFKNFASIPNLLNFIFPPLMTVLLLPFIYFSALLFGYDNLFSRIDYLLKKNSELTKFLKIIMLKTCWFNLKKLNKFSKEMRILDIQSKDDVLLEIRRIKQGVEL